MTRVVFNLPRMTPAQQKRASETKLACYRIFDDHKARQEAGEAAFGPDFHAALDALAAQLDPGVDREIHVCPWAFFNAEEGQKPVRNCRCTHLGCSFGWLDDLVPGDTAGGEESEAAAKRCPTCNQARLVFANNEEAKSRTRKMRGWTK